MGQRRKLFPTPRKKTGTVCETGATGNVLFSTRILKESGFRFDERYALSGGEDYEFFRRVHQAGYLMVGGMRRWQSNGFRVPAPRPPGFSSGTSATEAPRCRSLHFIRLPGAVLAAMIALGRVLVGITCALMFVPLGRRYSVKGLVWAGYGLGLLFGLSGRRFSEYRTIHTV